MESISLQCPVTIKVKVTDSKDNQRTYTLNITRGKVADSEDDIYLDELELNEGELEFSKDDTSYTVNLLFIAYISL